MLVASFTTLAVLPAANALQPSDLTDFFPSSQAGADLPLRFHDAPSATVVSCTIRDYTGATLRTEQIKTGDDGRFAVSTQNLAAGFYELDATLSPSPAAATEGNASSTKPRSHSFTFLRLPPKPADATDKNTPYFFSADTAFSWLVPRQDNRPARINTLAQALPGGLARERLSWAGLHPAPGRFDWETDRAYETTRRAYETAGVKILEMFHDAPAWLGRGQNKKFPQDLVESARSWSVIGKRWERYWGAIEIWNEPNLSFGDLQPGDQYTPLVKAVRYALRTANVSTPIGGGVFAYLTPDYLSQCARNGLLDESDFISFHHYGDALGIEKKITEVRDWLREYGHESKPVWLTEIGQPWNGSNGDAAARSQQQENACVFAMQGVESRACGVAGWFPFVYPAYNEHGYNNFGMTDERGLPLRSTAAAAAASRLLAQTSYAGDLALPDIPGNKNVRKIRVFDKTPAIADEVLVIVYTGDVAEGAAVTLPFAVKSALGVDGRALLPVSSGRGQVEVPVPDGLVYVIAGKSAIAPYLDTRTEAMRLTKIANSPPPPLPDVSPIVLQPSLDLDASKITAVVRGYILPPEAEEGAGLAIPVTVRVNNLSGKPHEVSLSHNALHDGAAGEAVVIEPHSFKDAVFNIDPLKLPARSDGVHSFVVKATHDGDGGRVAPVAVDFIPSLGLEQYLAQNPYQFTLPIAETHRWQANANGRIIWGKISPEAKWGYRVKFSKGDRWAYPRFSIPQEVELDRVTGVLLRARCEQAAEVRLMSWDQEGAQNFTTSRLIPADGKWHVACVPLSAWLKPDADNAPLGRQLHKLSLGMNGKTDENAIEVSDFYLIGQ
ncbi:glycosyhydrolase [Opitutaceae bacterium TAV5]|nr:glycosyhydrolase [Opitutaceae bacterium TAV5]